MTQEALKLALEWLDTDDSQKIKMAKHFIEQALAQPAQETPKGWKSEIWKSVKQPEQEPVTWGVDWGKAGDIPCVSIIKRVPNGGIEVMAVEYAPYSYTTPPQCKPLSSVELVKIELSLRKYHDYDRYDLSLHDFARAIEAAHGIKE